MKWLARWSVLLACVSCGSQLSETMIKNHPKLSLDAMKPRVVEASAPIAPTWIHRLDRGAVDTIPFTGQAYAPTLEEAKAEASRDLLTAVASYVAVDVQSELETVERERSAGGKTESSVEATQRTKTRAAANLSGIRPDAVFWEKVLVSPLVPDRFAYRVYVHAKVQRAVITRARLARQRAREEALGRRTLVVLPFRSTTPVPGAQGLERAFVEELSRRLASAAELYVQDPDLVGGLVADAGPSEAEALSSVREALLPDFVIGGSYQVHAGRVKVTYTVYGADDVLATNAVVRNNDELFELEDTLAEQIAKTVGAAPKRTEIAPPAPAASDLYYAAYEAYAAGDNDQALAVLARAIETDDSDPRFHLRLGRVLERLGRYGTTRPRVMRRQSREPLRLCTPWHLITPEDPVAFVEAADAAPPAVVQARVGADLDDVVSAMAYLERGGPRPEVGVPVVAKAAIGAYWNAFVRAYERKDRRTVREVRIAIADLLLRNDRIAPARANLMLVLDDARGDKDLHHESLALVGLGRASRELGTLVDARNHVLAAREIRRRTLERPYLLEIENELGRIEIGLDHYTAARAHYAEALRIADDLDDDYFRAVLGNNLGVLELLVGRADRAEVFFHRAWRALSDLDEAEGRISTNLNIAYLDGMRGDLDAARTYLEMARKLVEETGQSGRRAQMFAQEGRLESLRGRHLDALRALIFSEAIFNRTGRSRAALRLRTNVVAAELEAALALPDAEERSERVRCLRMTMARINSEHYRVQGGAYPVDHLYAYLGVYLLGAMQ